MTSLNGWHPGERSIHQKLGFADEVALRYTSIQGDIPPEHALFYETCLPFIPVTTLDERGRPWGSLLTGKDGAKGFVQSPNHTKLDVKSHMLVGDPLLENLRRSEMDGKVLIAGIGVEFETRRRNKFAGFVTKLECSNNDIEMELIVNEAIGNCPKYINVRDLEPCVDSNPSVVYDDQWLSTEDRLPDDVIDFVLARDTVFIGTSYVSSPENTERFPSRVGMNHRGGLPGFTRVRKDGRTLVLPDYSGNRMMTSLGNIEATSLASLTFIDFTNGDVLYLTGTAKNVVGDEAHEIMPLQNALTLIHTTGYIFIRDALPVHQKAENITQASPYSPPVRLLAEEAHINLFRNDNRPDALLSGIDIRSDQVMTLKWECAKDLSIIPGQAIILDCSTLIGARRYQHMAPSNPTSVNDDRIRTWTVSSASKGPTTRTFTITIRHKVGGAVTTAFFTIAQKLQQMRPELLRDPRPLNLTVKIAGITGDFTLPSPPPSHSTSTRSFVWFAGGIGITPFLSMLESLRESDLCGERVNVRLLLSARDATTLLPLLYEKYNGTNPFAMGTADTEEANYDSKIRLTVDVFRSQQEDMADDIATTPPGVVCQQYHKRLDAAYIDAIRENLVGGDVYVCGPDDYTRMIAEAVKEVGVDPDRIHSEGFTY